MFNRFILIVALILGMGVAVHAQDVKREGKVYVEQKKSVTKADENTGFKYKDVNGVYHDIFIGPSGACYIKRTSKNSGKEYKTYLGEKISTEICHYLGRDYKPKNK